MDSVTILTGRKFAAKVIRGAEKPEIVLPDTWYRCEVAPVSALENFHAVLRRVTASRHSLIIREVPRAGLDLSVNVRRLAENFDSLPQHWLMLDFDGIEAPPGMSPITLSTVDWLIRKQLPAAFHEADYITHFSSSAGTARAGAKIKVHTFFWLTQPVSSLDLRSWAFSVGADPALFHPVQPHFVADPIFEGCPDPLNGVRLFHVRKGQPEVDFVPPAVASGPQFGRHKSNGGGATGIIRNAAGLIVDGREGWLLKHLYSILARRVEHGESIASNDVLVEVWGDFQAECDLSGWSRGAVGGKVHATLERNKHGAFPALRKGAKGGMTPHYAVRPEPIAAIRAALTTVVGNYFRGVLLGTTVLCAPPGSGKSSAVILAIRVGNFTVDYHAPTLALAEAVAAAIGPDARIIRGRGKPDPTRSGAMMCDRHVMAAEVSRAGLSVSNHLCRGCPFRSSCSYLAQWRDPPRVLVMAHNYLGLSRPSSVRKADYVVIDESFLSVGIIQGKFPFSDLAGIRSYRLREAIREGLENGRLLETLDKAEITPDMLRVAQRGLFADQKPDIKGGMSDAEITAKLGKRRVPSRLTGFLGWLANELEAMKPLDVATETAGHTFIAAWLGLWWLARDISRPWWFPNWGLHFLRELFRATQLLRSVSHIAWVHEGEVHVSYPRKLHRLEGQPILHIDGTASKNIVERLLGPCTFRQWDAVRHAMIIQVTDHANGRQRILDNPDWLKERVARFAGRLPGRTFLCLQKEPRRLLTQETGENLPVPSDAHPFGLDIFHYGQATGLNGFEHHDNAVLVGRIELPAYAVEAYRGSFWNDPDPLLITGSFEYQDRGYGGMSGSGASVRVHPEPRLQVFLEQAREMASVQVLDRLRLCDDSPSPRQVFIFCNLPLPVAPDFLVSESDLIPEWGYLLDEAGGVLIDSPKFLAATLPARFSSPKGAENWLARGGSSVPWGCLCPNPSLHPKYTKGEVRVFDMAPPIAGAVFCACPKRRDRAPKQWRALSWLDPLNFYFILRNYVMKDIEAVITLLGAQIWVTKPTPAEEASARHAAERLAVHDANPEASAAQNLAEAGKAMATMASEGGRLGELPAISRADLLRDIARAPASKQAACMAFALAWMKAAIGSAYDLDEARKKQWLRWGPLNWNHIESDPLTDEQAYQVATEAAEQAEALLVSL